MSEFKVGDKVRFKDKSGEGNSKTVKGDVGIVIYIYGDTPRRNDEILVVHVKSRNIKYSAFSKRFEKVKPKMLENE